MALGKIIDRYLCSNGQFFCLCIELAIFLFLLWLWRVGVAV